MDSLTSRLSKHVDTLSKGEAHRATSVILMESSDDRDDESPTGLILLLAHAKFSPRMHMYVDVALVGDGDVLLPRGNAPPTHFP